MKRLPQDALILTPNASLAQQLRRLRLVKKGLTSAPKAKITFLQQWLLESIEPDLPVATHSQLELLWRQTIAAQQDQKAELTRLNPEFLASKALSAWRNLKQWHIPLQDLQLAETGQLLKFSHWVTEFEIRLQDLGLTALELEIEACLTQPASKQAVAALYGFVEPPAPLWTQWLKQNFEEIQNHEYESDFGEATGNAYLCSCTSKEDELVKAITWANGALSQNNDARIALINPNLQSDLKVTERLCRKLIDARHAINFARETPLNQQGAISTAIDLLQLNRNSLDLATIRHIVHSPRWGSFEDEYPLRAHWDEALCSLRKNEIRYPEFIDALCDDEKAKDIGKRLNKAFSDKYQYKWLLPIEWADRFQQQLEALGVYKANENCNWNLWNQTLDQYRELGQTTGKIDLNEALKLLKSLCGLSRVKSVSASPGLTVMDTVEAAADYTHVWILGMDSQQWPGAPNPNALLPVSLQIRYGLPHTHASQETELADKLVSRLKKAVPEVVFSYAGFQDELEISPSSLVADLPALHLEKKAPEIVEPDEMQWLDCSEAPDVPDSERQVRNGSALLRTMAASPFDAFASWRLGAVPLEEAEIGLSAIERGIVVHNILDSIWAELKDSSTLRATSEQDLQVLAEKSGRKELRKFSNRFGHQFVEMELTRLAQLITDWLELEKSRPEFKVELAEENLQATIGGLHFALRLDRLDRLEDGSYLLIDYKTGASLSRNLWLHPPPSEPQLPLYALTLEKTPDAICFAKVRPERMEFIGIGRDELFRGIQQQADWEDLIAEWKIQLEQLAQDYIRGESRVFETEVSFGQKDPLAPLHRYAEKEQLDLNMHLFVEPQQ